LPCNRGQATRDFDRTALWVPKVRGGIIKWTNCPKNQQAAAPSTMASVGGYLLTPDMFKYLTYRKQERPSWPRVQVASVSAAMMDDASLLRLPNQDGLL